MSAEVSISGEGLTATTSSGSVVTVFLLRDDCPPGFAFMFTDPEGKQASVALSLEAVDLMRDILSVYLNGAPTEGTGIRRISLDELKDQP
jgi:hypothetical protein